MDILNTDAYDRRRRRNMVMTCGTFIPPFPLTLLTRRENASTSTTSMLLLNEHFHIRVAVYFYLWIPESTPSPMAAGVKSAPVFSLALLVLSYNGGRSLLGVAGGLALSACGDICLIWKDYFIHGLYLLYLLLWGVSGGAYVYLLPFLRRSPDADIFVPAVSSYTLLIIVMATLAMRTRRLLVLLGGLSFIASDLTIVLQMFKVVESLDYGRHIIMTTYYLAQLLIAVGDVKATLAQEVDELGKWKRS